MSAARPMGHIAGLLSFTALNIRFRMAQAACDVIHVCWINDDGCLYLEQATHPAARAIARHAPEQILMRYRNQLAMTWRDIESDLMDARTAFVSRAIAEAVSA